MMSAAFRVQRVIKLGRAFSKPFNVTSLRNIRLQHVNTKFAAPCNYARFFSSQAAEANSIDTEQHNIIKDTEKQTGESKQYEFQSETRMLLDIVAKSLYSDKEVFIRELISNASDALEKLRYLRVTENLTSDDKKNENLEIHISTDKQNMQLIIQDTGVGMTRDELISHLGTIARSGSKSFLEQIKEKQHSEDASKIIGQFGVGFYSTFMVADKVEVFTKSYKDGAEGLRWVSDGSGTYEVAAADGVQPGTKIIMHLKPDCREFSDENVVNGIIKKYSNFVGSPIFVNGKKANVIQPLWMFDPKEVTPEQHKDFYRFVANSYDLPRFTLHYKTDVPLSIRALFYFPDTRPSLFDLSRDTSAGITLYSRKVMIISKAENILPKWLRFVKGVVDSEDIPLNLSRELLQNSALIGKLRNVLTSRILKFLNERSTKQVEEYNHFYKDYGLFLKEGIVTSQDHSEKEDIAKLLRFESSTQPSGQLVNLPEYCKRLAENQKEIYYLAAPSRELAESSPYYESLKKRNVEVLFCYEPYDELVLMQLRRFSSYDVTSAEKDMRDENDDKSQSLDLNKEEMDGLIAYMKTVLANKAHDIKTTTRLESHPCVITMSDMASARHFLRTQGQQLDEQTRYNFLRPRLEINPNSKLIKKLCQLHKTDPKLAELLTHQLYTGAMVGAGLVEDPRLLLTSLNELLTLALEKH